MDSTLRAFVRTRSNGRCEYCRMPESSDLLPFQPDHIVAIKHGGATAEDNLAWSCYDCNIFKGPNVAGVDPENGQVTRLFHPRRDDWSAFFRYQTASCWD